MTPTSAYFLLILVLNSHICCPKALFQSSRQATAAWPTAREQVCMPVQEANTRADFIHAQAIYIMLTPSASAFRVAVCFKDSQVSGPFPLLLPLSSTLTTDGSRKWRCKAGGRKRERKTWRSELDYFLSYSCIIIIIIFLRQHVMLVLQLLLFIYLCVHA